MVGQLGIRRQWEHSLGIEIHRRSGVAKPLFGRIVLGVRIRSELSAMEYLGTAIVMRNLSAGAAGRVGHAFALFDDEIDGVDGGARIDHRDEIFDA